MQLDRLAPKLDPAVEQARHGGAVLVQPEHAVRGPDQGEVRRQLAGDLVGLGVEAGLVAVVPGPAAGGQQHDTECQDRAARHARARHPPRGEAQRSDGTRHDRPVVKEGAQVRLERGGALVARPRPAMHAHVQDRSQLARQTRAQLRRAHGLARRDAGQDLGRRALVGRPQGHQVVERRRQAVHVAGGTVALLMTQALGRHVRRRAQHRVPEGQARVLVLERQPEVQEHRLARLAHQDVRRLDVAVQHAGFVDRLQAGGQLCDPAHHEPQVAGLVAGVELEADAQPVDAVGVLGLRALLLAGEPAARDLGQGRAGHPLHHDVGGALFGQAAVVDGDHRAVLHRGHGLGLAHEALQRDLGVEQALAQDLDRDRAGKPAVLGLVDDTHGAAADATGQHVALAEGLAQQAVGRGAALEQLVDQV